LTSLQDFCIWDLVLPLDVSYLSETSHMKLVSLIWRRYSVQDSQPNSRTDRTAAMYTA